MKRKAKKFYLLLCLFVVFLNIGLVFAQEEERELEIKYPGANFETLQKDLLPHYIKYILNFIIGLAGFAAFISLVVAGIRYLTSTGIPAQLESAKKQILSAFLGILILLASYLILTAINPQLVVLKLPGVERFPLPPAPEEPPSAPPTYSNYLWRITEIADSIKNIINGEEKGILKSARDININTATCNCSFSHPMCLCQLAGALCYAEVGCSCSASYCYSQKPDEPCPDIDGIEKAQQNIIASRSEILYYKNRASNEREDILLEIVILDDLISYYQDQIKAEEEYLAKITGDYGKEAERQYIEALIEKKTELETKKPLYEVLGAKLADLTNLIDQISSPIKELSKLPEQCLFNIAIQCQGACTGGCHDARRCAPDSCSGDNPCPIAEITGKLGEIETLAPSITDLCDEIIQTIIDITKAQ